MFERWLPSLRRKERESEGREPGTRGALDLFEDFLGAPFGDFPFGARGLPAVDVRETDNEVRVNAELPGMDPKDIDLRIERGVMTIRGEKKVESEHKDECCHRTERRYGSFSRSIALPCPVREDQITAEYKNGVLSVTLPKDEKAKPKRIEISG